MPVSIMRALVYARPGDAGVVEVREVPRPVPGPAQVLVRVRAAALNRADILQREGKYPPPSDAPSDIPGLEFAGEVAVLGAGVEGWRLGERVFGIVGGGAQAEYVVTHERALVRIPDRLDWSGAAATPEAFITAHDALVAQAELRPSERVLINAVGSGVGMAAVQLVRAMGAVPYGTARGVAKIDAARRVGLEDGVVVGGDLAAIALRAGEWTGGEGLDVVLDLLGGDYVSAGVAALGVRGRLILIGTLAGGRASIPLGSVLGARLTIRGTVLRARALEEKLAAIRAFARQVVPLLARGVVHPVVDSEFELSEARAAHARMESNETIGKVVLQVSD